MESRVVNCNGLYVTVCQWGEMLLNIAPDKQTLMVFMFYFCA